MRRSPPSALRQPPGRTALLSRPPRHRPPPVAGLRRADAAVEVRPSYTSSSAAPSPAPPRAPPALTLGARRLKAHAAVVLVTPAGRGVGGGRQRARRRSAAVEAPASSTRRWSRRARARVPQAGSNAPTVAAALVGARRQRDARERHAHEQPLGERHSVMRARGVIAAERVKLRARLKRGAREKSMQQVGNKTTAREVPPFGALSSVPLPRRVYRADTVECVERPAERGRRYISCSAQPLIYVVSRRQVASPAPNVRGGARRGARKLRRCARRIGSFGGLRRARLWGCAAVKGARRSFTPSSTSLLLPRAPQQQRNPR
jgi:hypothetical protein